MSKIVEIVVKNDGQKMVELFELIHSFADADMIIHNLKRTLPIDSDCTFFMDMRVWGSVQVAAASKYLMIICFAWNSWALYPYLDIRILCMGAVFRIRFISIWIRFVE